MDTKYAYYSTSKGYRVLGGTAAHFLKADGSLDNNNYLTTDTAQNVNAIKSFITAGGNAIENNTLRVYSADGSNPGLTFFKNGVDAANMYFDGIGNFKFRNGTDTDSRYIFAKGYKVDGLTDASMVLGGGGSRPVADFNTAAQSDAKYLQLNGGTMTGAVNHGYTTPPIISRNLSTTTGTGGGFARDTFQLIGSNGIVDAIGHYGRVTNATVGNVELVYGYIGGSAFNVKNAIRWTSDGRVGIGLTGSNMLPNVGYDLTVAGNTVINGSFALGTHSIKSTWIRTPSSLTTTNKVFYLIIDGFTAGTNRQLVIEVESVAGNGQYKKLKKVFNINFNSANNILTNVSKYTEITGVDTDVRYGIGELEKLSDTSLRIPLIWLSSASLSTNQVTVKSYSSNVNGLIFSTEYDATSVLTTEVPLNALVTENNVPYIGATKDLTLADKNLKFTTGAISKLSNNSQVFNNVYQSFLPTAQTGMLCFKLAPQSAGATMFDVTLKIYGYDSRYSGDVRVTFYRQSGAVLPASGLTATITATDNFPSTVVRVGVDNADNVSINLGDITTVWGLHATVVVDRVIASYNGFNIDWGKGWSHAIETSLAEVPTTYKSLQIASSTVLSSKKYADDKFLPLAGGEMAGALTIKPSNGASVFEQDVITFHDTGITQANIIPLAFKFGTSTTPNAYIKAVSKGVSGVNGALFQFFDNTTKHTEISSAGVTSNSFIKSGGLPTQFLKADGGVDATVYTSVANVGGVEKRTLTLTTPAYNTTGILRLNLGVTSFVGYLKIKLTGSYSSANVNGYVEVTGGVGANTGSTWNNSMKCITSLGLTRSGFYIDPVIKRDATDNQLYYEIHKKLAANNQIYIEVESRSINASQPILSSTFDASAIVTTLTNEVVLDGSITALSFNKSGGLATQFLKADGSVDSNVYLIQTALNDYAKLNAVQTFSEVNTFTKSPIVPFANNATEAVNLGQLGDSIDIASGAILGYVSSNYINKNEKGAVNGVAGLDGNGQVPASQLPSYVDDVLEFDNLAGFPTVGERGKIYVATDTNLTYRWSGTAYIKIADGAVQSVNGQTGVVVLNKTHIGLPNVDNTADSTKNVLSATKLNTPRNIAITGDATYNVNFDGSANATSAITLAATGVTAGIYKSVTVDAKGRVTGGTNPTTLAGYGITDAMSTTHAANGITATNISNWNTVYTNNHTHSNKTVLDGTQESFTTVLKNKLDGLSNYTLPIATTNVYGGVRLITDTQNNISPNAITTTLNRSYAVQLNNANQMLVNIPWTDTVYTHPTTAGNRHIPAGGSTNQILKWSSDGTAIWANPDSVAGNYMTTDTDQNVTGSKSIINNNFPFKFKINNAKSWTIHKPNNNFLNFAPSATADAEDWDWQNQVIFDDEATIEANKFKVRGGTPDKIMMSDGSLSTNYVTTNTFQSITAHKIFEASADLILNGDDNNNIQSFKSSNNFGGNIVSGWLYSHYTDVWKAGCVRNFSSSSEGFAFDLSTDSGATFNRIFRIQADGNLVTNNFGRADEWKQAHGWGNHAQAGYVKPNSDGKLSAKGFINTDYNSAEYIHTTDGGAIHKSDLSGGGTFIDEIINDQSDYAIRLDPHEYEIDSFGSLEVDDRNRLIHIIGEQIKMVVNFREIYPKQQIVIYNFDQGGTMAVKVYGKTIYNIKPGCFIRLYVTKSRRVIVERDQPNAFIW